MATLASLVPAVEVNVAGCPVPAIEDAILRSLIEFCTTSRAYRITPDDIAVTANATEIDVELPSGTEIAWLIDAELDDVPLDILPPTSVPKSWAVDAGNPSAAVVISAAQIALRPLPSASGTLRASFALRPSLKASSYPDDLHALYQEHIVAGALARLYAQPKKEWSDPVLAQYARSQFEAGISSAEYRADRGSANAPARTSLSLIGGR